jgi:hypothetical protein
MDACLQIELTRHPPQSVTWLRILENGDFEVEYYDYSCDDESPFPHDFAIMNLVTTDDLPAMKKLLGGQSDLEDEAFLDLVARKFSKRSEIEEWCQANGIPCRHHYEQA